MLKDGIAERVKAATNLNEVRDAVIAVFEEARTEKGVIRIGYVSGIITSDGPEYVERNLAILARHTENLRLAHDFPIFSSTDVFDNKVFERINANKIPVQAWLDFWREILESGHITDMFMTPRWEVSIGARDEYQNAQRLGLKIHK